MISLIGSSAFLLKFLDMTYVIIEGDGIAIQNNDVRRNNDPTA